jgi:hypothetical protein
MELVSVPARELQATRTVPSGDAATEGRSLSRVASSLVRGKRATIDDGLAGPGPHAISAGAPGGSRQKTTPAPAAASKAQTSKNRMANLRNRVS